MNSRLLSAALLFTLLAAPRAVHAAVPQLQKEQLAPPVAPPVDQSKRPSIEVTFVLDTTSSMGGLLEGAKQKIWSIASKIARGQPTPKLKVGLVAFRDVGDEYVTKRFDLTEDLDAVFTHLRAFRAEGGGDTPEHLGRGLGEAVKLISWNQDPKVMKMIFVVGDAPPQHYNDGWDHKVWAKKAIERGIMVNTIRCGSASDTEVAMREISRLGDGSYTSIDQGGGMLAVRTPYDEKLAELNSAIATKSVYVGHKAARAEAKTRARMVADMPAEAAADRIGYLGSMGAGGGGSGYGLSMGRVSAAPMAVSGSVDVTSAPARLAEAREEDLPEELRAIAPEARKQRVEELGKERRQLEDKALAVAKERQAWIEKSGAEKADSFDNQVMKDVKGKAVKYGISY